MSVRVAPGAMSNEKLCGNYHLRWRLMIKGFFTWQSSLLVMGIIGPTIIEVTTRFLIIRGYEGEITVMNLKFKVAVKYSWFAENYGASNTHDNFRAIIHKNQ